jgi:hypothetical protein
VISRVRNPKDFWAGLIYLAIGLSAVYIAQDYRMGSAIKMGPGYFPTMLGGLLALIGTVSLIRSFVRPGEAIGTFALKGLVLIVAGTALTGFLIRHAGLVVALPLLVIITAYGSIKFRWGAALALAAGLTVFCAVVFVKALGLPVPLFGTWFN